MLSTQRNVLTGLSDDQVAIKTAGPTPDSIQRMSSSRIKRQGQMELEMKMNHVFKKYLIIITFKILFESGLKGQCWLNLLSIFKQNNQVGFRASLGSLQILFQSLSAAQIPFLSINPLTATHFPCSYSFMIKKSVSPNMEKPNTDANTKMHCNDFFLLLFFFSYPVAGQARV